MQYLITFLEGIITFISPCLLPMLPIYILYFAGGSNDKRKTFINALGFVTGFTILFVTLGAFSAAIGSMLHKYQTTVNIITGTVVVIFGLNFTGILKIGFLNSTHKAETDIKPLGFISSLLFGIVFAIGWTPCVGAFLGSALMLASQQGSIMQGVLMLLVYSIGLGLPFIMSAILIERLKGMFGFIKNNYKIINIICGIMLILIGFLMMTGFMSKIVNTISL